jgi:predicted GNAT superfamily acetyltransferase
MYGDGTSDLHRGLGTDRLVVAWPLVGEPHRSCCPSGDAADLPAPLREAPLLDDAPPDELGPPRLALRLAIPLDVHAELAADPAAGARWRLATRRAFRWALAHGYGVAGVYRDRDAGRAYYVLTASDPAS